ncbi:MAG: hypothetical protein WBQ50_13640 [Nocardioides sp.]
MDRLRCSHCRNPIKPHQATSGPASGENAFHEDCWAEAGQSAATGAEQQLDYQRRIAREGLAALLSPYVTTLPQQREGSSSPIAV